MKWIRNKGARVDSLRDPKLTERLDLTILFLCAIALRVIYLDQYTAKLPFIYGPIADSVAYLEQAFRVRSGEFGAPVLLAFSPLYGYFLALVRVDRSLVLPILLQLLLGCLALLMLYVFVLRNAGRRAALFSAALYLGYGTLLYFESKILSDALGLFLVLLASGLYLGNGVREGRLLSSLAAGAIFGLSVLARASLIFCTPFIILCAALPWNRPCEPRRAVCRRAVALAFGLTAVFCANGVWTKVHSGLFVPVILVSRTVETSSRGAFRGVLSDATEGEEIISSYAVVEQARARLANKRNGNEKRVNRTLFPAIDIKGWLVNAPSKLCNTLINRESSFQYGYLGEKSAVSLLRWLPISFGMILLWGVAGAVWLARRDGIRALSPYLPLALGVFITTTLYHPSSRYRLALIVPLLLLAGMGLEAIVRLYASSIGKGIAILMLLLSLFFAQDHVRQKLANRAEFELQLASSSAVAGDRKAAWRHAQNAARAAPKDPSVQRRVRMFSPYFYRHRDQKAP
ncbi:MAG: glycosyltransferase family 39 protein [Deltaproteobacteria bacterium]|nr:glycosyltransferase family 39 protein [Deltaproteobacteria bacterium]